MNKTNMLEAYKKNETIKALESRLPAEVNEVQSALEPFLNDREFNSFAWLVLARCHVCHGDLSKARQALERILGHDQEHVSARAKLAKVLYAEGDVRDAIKHMTDASNKLPEITENWQLLAEYLQQDKQEKASKGALNQYDMIKLFNDNLSAAEHAFQEAEFVRADKICRQLLTQVPNEPRALRLLARLARQFGHFEISTSLLANCIEMKPRDASVGLDYGYSLLANNRVKDALEQCHRLAGFAPEHIGIYELKAEALFNLGRYEEAISIFRELSEIPERRSLSLLHLGKVLNTVGETTQAINCMRQSMEGEAIPAQAFWELANLKSYKFSDEDIASMQQLLKAENISAINKVFLQFALGKALEDAEQYVESFQYYQSANKGYTRIRPVRYSNQNARLKSFFTTTYFSGLGQNGNASKAPIFVLGLPRSGSTLTEQILGSHSQVDATAELAEIISIARELNNSSQPGQGQYPQCLASFSAGRIQELAQRYLDYAQPFRQQAAYFVDKAPGNFHHIGLIKTLFPNARIIDIRRNPMASGWSLYKHFFADSFKFSYDLVTIGKYYNEYIELMDHWHTVLPGQILTIRYEDLVNDLPASVDKILQYCGLEFEEACLDFHLNKRAVTTPSSEQVRRPIYSDALEQWKNYEAFLSPLAQVVGKHALAGEE